MRRFLGMAAALVLFWACDAPLESPTTPELSLASASDLSDGRNGGTDGFYFIPPIAPNVSSPGTPNMGLSPYVRICPLDASLSPDCSGNGVIEFGEEELDKESSHYQANWDTKKNNTDGYRVFVLHPGADTEGSPLELEIGYRDVWGCGKSCAPPAGDFYVFNAGNTVPVKFRLEGGVLCGLQTLGGTFVDCVEGELGSTQIITPEFKAGVIVCDGSVGDPVTSCTPADLSQGAVTILVYREIDEYLPSDNDPTRCIDALDMPQGSDQDSGCYRVRVLTPGFTQIESGKRAFVTLCVDEGSFPGGGAFPEEQEEAMVMFKEANDGTIEVLRTVVSQLGCGGNVPVAMAPAPSLSPFARFASAGWSIARRAIGWIAPEPLLAMLDRGRGGELETFSLFTVALTGTYEQTSPDGIVAPPGTVISPSPGVTVTSTDALSVDFGVSGARVRFSIPDASADGAVICEATSCASDGQGDVIVVTDANGIATLDTWTLGSTSGTYLVDAAVTGACPADDPLCAADGTDFLRFTATVCAPNSGIGTATVDAIIEATEWQCAYSQPFQANLSGGSSIPAEWKWMNDGANLYVALIVERDADDNRNVLRLDFDDDGDLAPDAGDNVIEVDADVVGPNGQLVDKHLIQKCVNSNQSGCGVLDAVQHGFGAFANDGTQSFYELSFPLVTGDGEDFDVAAGLRAFLTLGIGNGAQGNTQVPAFRDYSCVLIPGAGDVPPIGGCAIQ